MKKIEISLTMVVFTLFLSCKSSINPTTTIGREGDTVTAGTQESTQQSESADEMAQQSEDTDTMAQQSEETDAMTRQSEASYDTSDPTVSEPAEGENTEEMQYNGSTGANTNSREMDMSAAPDTDYDAMFSYLEMTDDQIQQFNSAMETYRNNSGGNSMDDSIDEKQDDVLSVILTPKQQELYATWKRDN